MGAQQTDPVFRWLAVLMLAHWFGIVLLSLVEGRAQDAVWMSHNSLLLTSIAFLTDKRWLSGMVLIVLAVPHSVWLVDVGCLLFMGYSPWMFTASLAEADFWGWFGAVHHFYLLPILVVYHRRNESAFSPVWALGAWAILIAACLLGRVVSGPNENVNFSYSLMAQLDHPLMVKLNSASPAMYLIGLQPVMLCVVVLPGWLLARYAVRPKHEIGVGCVERA